MTLKIMPLGDSITQGWMSSTNTGYRLGLFNRLGNADFTFVGSLNDGVISKPMHEGHGGFRIDQIQDIIQNKLDTYNPDVVLLHLGTNDMIQNYDVTNASLRLASLISTIEAAGAQAIVAKIVPNQDSAVNARVSAYNLSLPFGSVDMSILSTAVDYANVDHPNDAGYDKMAKVWYDNLITLFGSSLYSKERIMLRGADYSTTGNMFTVLDSGTLEANSCYNFEVNLKISASYGNSFTLQSSRPPGAAISYSVHGFGKTGGLYEGYFAQGDVGSTNPHVVGGGFGRPGTFVPANNGYITVLGNVYIKSTAGPLTFEAKTNIGGAIINADSSLHLWRIS